MICPIWKPFRGLMEWWGLMEDKKEQRIVRFFLALGFHNLVNNAIFHGLFGVHKKVPINIFVNF